METCAAKQGDTRFAKEEPQLFRLLFMRDRTHEPVTDGKEEMRPIPAPIEQSTGLCPDDAYLFHLKMWLYGHGISAIFWLRKKKGRFFRYNHI